MKLKKWYIYFSRDIFSAAIEGSTFCDQSALLKCQDPLDKYKLGPDYLSVNSKKAFPMAKLDDDSLRDACKWGPLSSTTMIVQKDQ